jgi:hypothetical protein
MAVTPVDKVKSWLTPGLVTCFGVILWNLFTEIRTDIKTLLSANAEVQVRIQSLEKRMDGLETVVYAQRVFALKPDEVEIPKRNRN